MCNKNVDLMSYVCGNGCVKTGGNFIGSLGSDWTFDCSLISCLATFDSADGAAFGVAFLGASSDVVGFGAVIDGNGGDATADDDVPFQ